MVALGCGGDEGKPPGPPPVDAGPPDTEPEVAPDLAPDRPDPPDIAADGPDEDAPVDGLRPVDVDPPDDADPDFAGVCSQANASCATTPCCVGSTCVGFPAGELCAADCTQGDECVSGCCAPLENEPGAVCAPTAYCGNCKSSGELGCDDDDDCCPGAVCITETVAGGGTRDLCLDTCTSNAECFTGCCAPLSNSTDRICFAAEICMPATPPTSSTAPGMYMYTVVREKENVYKAQGRNLWITTKACTEPADYVPATVVWNGKLASGNTITFPEAKTCEVDDLLTPP